MTIKTLLGDNLPPVNLKPGNVELAIPATIDPASFTASVIPDLPSFSGVNLAAGASKIDEAANKLKAQAGGWNGFDKIKAFASDKVKSAQEFFTGKKKLEAQGLTPAQVEEELRRMSPAAPIALDELQSELQTQRFVEEQVTAAQLRAIIGADIYDDSVAHKVKLIEKGGPGTLGDFVIFDIMPEVVESRTVEYEAVAPPQNPSAFQKYKGTSSTQWTVNATLTARNTEEATENLRIINVLRGWTMPFFGEKIRNTYRNKLGAPPPVLEFSGWRKQMVGPVQVVITSLNWNFPQDVDYIPAFPFSRGDDGVLAVTKGSEMIPFPSVIKVAIQLVESFSTDQINSFDLSAFRTGNFDKAFEQAVSQEASAGGKRSATGLPKGGTPASEEAQRAAAASAAASATPDVSDGSETSGVVTQAASVEDGFGQDPKPNAPNGANAPPGQPGAPGASTAPGANGPANPNSQPTPPATSQEDLTREARATLAERIKVTETTANQLQASYDAQMARAAKVSATNPAGADEIAADAAPIKVRADQLKAQVAALGKQYEVLLGIPQGDEGE